MSVFLNKYQVHISFLRAILCTLLTGILVFYPEYSKLAILIIVLTLLTMPFMDYIEKKEGYPHKG